MATQTDEEYGPDGKLLSTATRSIAEDAPQIIELYETRKQVKAIASNNVPGQTIPLWGRVLAKFMLQLSFYMVQGRETDDAPVI